MICLLLPGGRESLLLPFRGAACHPRRDGWRGNRLRSRGASPLRIILYSYLLSPFAAKVHTFLRYQGLPFETAYVDPRRAREDLPLGSQVPVLRIDDESRADSTPIGCWLDERFPDAPRLLPPEEPDRRQVLEIDRWVTDRMIPVAFRTMLATGEPWWTRVRSRRRGARALHATVTGGLPLGLRILYPLLVSRPRFIRRQLALADPDRSLRDVQSRLCAELTERLEGGPFLGGRTRASLADLSAYPQLVLPHLAGYARGDYFRRHEAVTAWLGRVGALLDPSVPLLPTALVERRLPWPTGQPLRADR